MFSSTTDQFVSPARRRFEVVERKGIGHPDTMADLIAEQFSYLYSSYCRTAFGQVLNHAVDKVTLIGASTKVRLGGFTVIEPAEILLIGKITPGVASERVPVHDLLRTAVDQVVRFSLPDDEILRHTNLVVRNTFSSAVDRPENFYLPDSRTQAHRIGTEELGANDTVFCTGSAGRSPLEELVLRLELAVTAPAARSAWSSVGTDVKVMAVRCGDDVDVTMCVPVDPRAVTERADYEKALGVVTEALTEVVAGSGFPVARLHVNTKDVDGGLYLAPFGTSFGKSDCGAVGRGNRHEGFIAAFRPANVEAPAGKNPLHHAGKLYTLAAQRIADDIHRTLARDSAVAVVARNGAPLTEPAYVHVDFDGGAAEAEAAEVIAAQVIAGIPAISEALITRDPVSQRRTEAEALRPVVPGRGVR
ncbi:methionine adenosyltransferase [Streptomyces sp. TLI_053]|uniref:methionine adenosyltransferase n=1 Tax=Streptomyces sp. TLI_053 TaxID=1855352 RepID=UPI0008796932|nr:methionine adenosyltransferase [Streptomyces sp. TLI_053]SDT83348.1 methionine adenosyltransferase [Streptomyces sp. TLI_053]